MARGGQPGNNNATKNRPFAQAIERALKKRSKTEQAKDLLDVAEKLIDMAADGDMQAIKELADRTDGKAKQAIVADVDSSITIEVVKDFEN